jgi:spermidine/putrescine transport system ATP-binding protein
MLEDFKVRFSGHTFPCLDSGFSANEPVDVVIRPEDVDIVPLDRCMLTGKVTSLTFKGDYYEIITDVCGFKWMIETSDAVEDGATVGLSIDPDAIHVMKKSEYSGKYGDYSTYSEEAEHLSDVDATEDEE